MTSEELYYSEDGKLYGQDINEYFVGDPTAEEGIIPEELLKRFTSRSNQSVILQQKEK